VCERERDREGETERESERERKRKREKAKERERMSFPLPPFPSRTHAHTPSHTHTYTHTHIHTHIQRGCAHTNALNSPNLIRHISRDTHVLRQIPLNMLQLISKPTKSRNSNSSVQIQIDPKSHFEFVPRDTKDSKFLHSLDFGSVAFSVATVTTHHTVCRGKMIR